MARPTILSVDDDRGVARAVERDLRRRYGDRYRILSADSGAGALDITRQLKARDDDVALFVADQRMPQMNGVEFLEQAVDLFPFARRVLLTAYADTNAAIKAINDVSLDYYLLKPWDPPEEQLYPVIDDLLEDWKANRRKPTEGIRVIGHRFSRESHEVRDFLARNGVPYRWFDVEQGDEARRLLEAAGAENGDRLPALVFPDGSALQAPERTALAEKIGLATRAELPFYDLVIVGGGPAGLAAAVYGASEGLRTVMVEREAPGGQAGQSSRIENYLGFPVGLSGADLARRAQTQARRFGAEMLAQEVGGLEQRGTARTVRLADGSELGCHTVLVATGVSYRRLEAPGVEELTGKGVYYGASLTESIACENQDVFLVGAANSAGQAAVYFAKYARTVTMLIRGDSLTKSMSRYLIDQIEETENIVVRPGTQVVGAEGDGHLERLRIRDAATGEETVDAATLFIFIGALPHTDWLDGDVARDQRGFVLAGPDLIEDGRRGKLWALDRDPYLLESSMPGVFVAGDVRHQSLKRVASAVGEGAMAVQFVHQYLGGL